MLDVMIWGGLRVAAALLLMMGIVVLLRSASAATRHVVWRAGFAVALLLPLVAAALPWKLEVLPGAVGAAGLASTPTAAVESESADDRGMPVPEEAEAPVYVAPVTPAPYEPVTVTAAPTQETRAARGFDWPLFLLLVWLTGTALLGARLVTGHVAVRRIVRGGTKLRSPDWTSPLYEAADILDVAVDVDLVTSDRVTMPFTAGVRRPVIVLPESADAWDLARRRAVLMHELAHVRRRDLVPHHVARWVCALHWFNPLAWAGARRMRAESERAADDLVLSAGTRASDYADHLLQIVSSAGRSLMPAPALPLAQRREFEGRMLAILEPGIRRRGPGRAQSLAVSALVLLMTLPLAALDREGAADAAAREDALAREHEARAAEHDVLAREHDRKAREHDREARVHDALGDASTERDAGGFGPVVDPAQPVMPRQPRPGKLQALIDGTIAPGFDAAVLLTDPSTEAVGALVGTLSTPNVDARQAAIAALGGMEDPRAVQALIRILRDDPVADVRAAAAWALGEIEDPAAVPALAHALGNDGSAEVRGNAAWALGQIESPQAVEALGAALDDASPDVRRNAMWALGQIESADAVPYLVSALGSDDADIRETAAWALGEIESPDAVQALMPLVTDAVPAVREAVVHALSQIEDPAAAPALVRALADGNADVRAMAAHAISDMELTTAPPALINALRDTNEDVRMAAAHALGHIGDGAAVDGLLAALEDVNADVQIAAMHALLEMDEEVAEEALLQMLQHSDADVRKHAAEALAD